MSKSLNTSALTRTFQALADPTRREILRLLADGDLNAGQIAANFDMTLPSVSHHLSVLKNANLVGTERDGQSIVYSLNASVAQEALQLLLDLTGAGKPLAKPRARRTAK